MTAGRGLLVDSIMLGDMLFWLNCFFGGVFPGILFDVMMGVFDCAG